MQLIKLIKTTVEELRYRTKYWEYSKQSNKMDQG